MSYINARLGLFVISLSLFLIALDSESNNYGFIIVGIVVNFIGAAVLLTGAIKIPKRDN